MCHLQADAIKSPPSFLLHPFLVCYVLCKTWNIWPQGEIGSGVHTRIHKSWLNLTRIHKSWLNLNHYRSEFCYHIILTAMGSVLLSDNSLHNGLFVWRPGSSKGEHTPSLDEACHRPANEGAQMLGTGAVRDEWQVPRETSEDKSFSDSSAVTVLHHSGRAPSLPEICGLIFLLSSCSLSIRRPVFKCAWHEANLAFRGFTGCIHELNKILFLEGYECTLFQGIDFMTSIDSVRQDVIFLHDGIWTCMSHKII